MPHETEIEIEIITTDGTRLKRQATLQQMIDLINSGTPVFAGGVKMDTAILQNALNRLRSQHDEPIIFFNSSSSRSSHETS